MGHKHLEQTLIYSTRECWPMGQILQLFQEAPHCRVYYRSGEGLSKARTGVADELRGRVKTILKKVRTPRQNITKEECKAIGELKRDNNRLILTADKGVALVVMDKEDYVQKAKEFLDQPTYRTITNDPTTKYKNKLVNLLKAITTEGEIDEALYKRLYLTGAGSPKFYGLPKIHKRESL